MASVLSESLHSTRTSTIQSPLRPFQIFPMGNRSYVLGEDPGEAQIRLNRLVAEALHGESSSELKGAEFRRAGTRALVNFSVNQDKEKRRRFAKTYMNEDIEMSMDRDDGWESIQEYGNFLREAADTFQEEAPVPSSPVRLRSTLPSFTDFYQSRNQEQRTQNPPVEGVSWRHFHLNAEFAHLAPLTARENRIHAQQSGKLIDWILDPANDELFLAWSGLDQAGNPPPASAEAQRRRNHVEMEALARILEGTDEQPSGGRFPQTAELGRGAADSQSMGSFAKYLSMEAPEWSRRGMETRIINAGPSRTNSMGGGSDEDTRSVVSQDNHWRRTIFG